MGCFAVYDDIATLTKFSSLAHLPKALFLMYVGADTKSVYVYICVWDMVVLVRNFIIWH